MLITLSVLSSFAAFFFFFNDTATTEIYTLSLHDALPISQSVMPSSACGTGSPCRDSNRKKWQYLWIESRQGDRSEEHTSELQSRSDLVCRLLLEKKKKSDSRYAEERCTQGRCSRFPLTPL